MKKIVYSLVGCAAILAVGTAQGSDAVSQALSTLGIVSPLSNDGHNDDAYLRLGSPTDFYPAFNSETGFVDISFTAPGSAWWSDDYEYLTDEEKAETSFTIKLFRNKGSYFDEAEAELIKEYENVKWLDDITFTDDAELEHGQRYCYCAVGELYGRLGDRATYNVLVGYQIDAATNFSVRSGEGGGRNVVISFTAPTTCADGKYTIPEDVTIPYIEITRRVSDDWYSDPTVIKTFENVKPGEDLSYTDEDEALEDGTTYQYRLRLFFDGQEQLYYTNFEEVFVGNDLPQAPSSVQAMLQPDGSVKVTWEAPTEGVHGAWFDPEHVTYKVERGCGVSTWDITWEVIADQLTETAFIDEGIVEEGSYFYRVTSQLDGKDSENMNTYSAVVAGPPAPFPFVESWPDAKAQHSTWDKSSSWTVYSQTSMAYYDENGEYTSVNIFPADADGGLIYFYPSYYDNAGDVANLTSGRISLEGAVNPILRFMYFDLDTRASDNTIQVLVSADGGDFVALEGDALSNFAHDNTWAACVFSLADFVGKAEYIQVRFAITVGSLERQSFIDCIEIRDARDVDLAVTSVASPVKFYPGAKMNVTVGVANLGDNDSDAFQLKLTIGDEELGYANCESVKANATATVVVPVTVPDAAAAGDNEITAEIVAEKDASSDNNTGAQAVEVVALPAAANLAFDKDTHIFSWDAADELPFFDGSVTVVENFENYEDCTNESFGQWTVIDGDGESTFPLPGVNDYYPNQGRETGGFVFTPSNYNAGWDTPTAGGKCFIFPGCSWYANDWLISPELDGTAQTISFKLATAPTEVISWISESYEICISSTTPTEDAFTVLTSESIDSEINWETVEFEVPEGTKYFAIHYTRYYGDMLAFCDFSFRTGSGLNSDPTEFVGYNLYCNDEKVNTDAIEGTLFSFPEGVTPTNGQYVVKAAYNNAESAASDPVEVVIAAVSSAVVDGNLISCDGGNLVINATGNYQVVTIGGQTIASGSGATRLSLSQGVYVVSVDGQIFKVAVK